MKARFRGEAGGVALMIVLAFMVLGVPVITSTLKLADTVAIDSRVKADALERNYCRLAAIGYIRYVALDSSRWENFLSAGADNMNLCGGMGLTVTQLPALPSEPPFLSSKKRRLFTTKEVSPASVLAGGQVEYVITVENQHVKKVDLKKIVDEMPKGFSYVADPTTLTGPSGSIFITDSDLTIKDLDLEWEIAGSGIELQSGETATLTFSATAAASDGVYCNEVYAEKGGKKTRSGKTAKVTVGSPGPGALCEGSVTSVLKTVDPEVVLHDTQTTYTYTIEIINEGTVDIPVKEIKDFIEPEFNYVPLSVTSDPAWLLPEEEPKIKLKSKHGVSYYEIKWKFKKEDLKVVPSGTTWFLQFQATATLPTGYYANEVEVRFDKTQQVVFPSAGPEGGPEFEYTYVVEIENDGTEDLTVKEIKVVTSDDFAYLPLSTSSTPPELQPDDEPDLKPNSNEIKWKFNGGDEVVLQPGTTWLLQFKATTTLPDGQYPISVDLKLEEHPDTDKTVDRATGPTAVVSSLDVYRITMTVGLTGIECNGWVVSDSDAGEYVEFTGCVI